MTAVKLRRCIIKLLWITALLAALHHPSVTAVLAHADYERSVPAADEVVNQAPQQVQVWFTQDLFRREGENSLEVYGPGELRVDLDDAAIDDDDRKLMTVSLQPDLADGVYIVRWRNLSADDGDAAEGEFQFSVRASKPTAEPDQPAPTATAENAQPTPTSTVAASTATAEDAQPTPTKAAQTEQAAPESTPAAVSDSSESSETPSDQSGPGMGLPCLGISVPALLFFGMLMLGRRRRNH